MKPRFENPVPIPVASPPPAIRKWPRPLDPKRSLIKLNFGFRCSLRLSIFGIRLWLLALALLILALSPHSPAAPVPVIHCTDLFHPHEDPDDHFDLATVFALHDLDVKAIILDQGERQSRQPGKIPVSQMNAITGRHVPAALGLGAKLKSPADKALDQNPEFQGGVQTILDTLRANPAPVMVAAVGSLRDLAAAFNREPDLFRAKLGKLLIFIGEASDPNFQEYNVALDPNAFVCLMRSGLPIYWVPCFDGGLGQNRGHASFWKASHADLLKNAPAPLIQYFIYALEKDKAPPLEFISSPVDPQRKARLFAGTRNLWCTAIFATLAGKVPAAKGPDYILAPMSPGADTNVAPLFRFTEVELYVTDDAVVHYGHRDDSRRVQRFEILQPARYAQGMTAITARLLSDITR